MHRNVTPHALTAALALLLPSLVVAADMPPVPRDSVEFVPLREVRLLPGPFADAVAANRRYLLDLDPDRLLAPFRLEAGLPAKAKEYGDWESGGLAGHTAGHYLAALAAQEAETGDAELGKRLDYCLAELKACQDANGDGYVGGVPGSHAFWADVKAGRFEANGFGINGKWVPWYNMHKTFAGLRDAAVVGKREVARVMFLKLCDWALNEIGGLSDEKMQSMMKAEHGGMAEVLADAYAMTGDARYLDGARRFTHHAVFDPLARKEDHLTGLHANTQIPKIIGYERIAELSPAGAATDYDTAAHFFWQTVTEDRSVAFGGNSVSEHFNPTDDFSRVIESPQGPETCNTYNMLRLTAELFRRGPTAQFADYYERALYNHILSAIHPGDDPGYVYFTPLRPDHYRVYSEAGVHFWCCVGTGMENPGNYGGFVYAETMPAKAPAADSHELGDLWVNLFMASEAKLPSHGLTVRQETRFPDESHTKLKLEFDRAHDRSTFTLHVRHPFWAGDGYEVKVNGKVVKETAASQPGSYTEIRRAWRSGDVVDVELPMTTRVEHLPDKSDWVAIMHGPILLAAITGHDHLDGMRPPASRMAHVASGELVPLDEATTLIGDETSILKHIKPVKGGAPFTFTIDGGSVAPVQANGAADLKLMPFFRLQDARYQMYWRLDTPEVYKATLARRTAEEAAKVAVESATIDHIVPGEQQPEVEHALHSEASETGNWQGRSFRHGSSFGYELRLKDKTADGRSVQAVALRLTFWGGDKRDFTLLIDGRTLADVHLDGKQGEKFIDVDCPIPADVLAHARASGGTLHLDFRATGRNETQRAGGIYDVRLMRVEP